MRKLLFITLFSPLILLAKVSNPSAVTLTWVQDPTTTMTIFWHTPTNNLPSYLHYRKTGQGEWTTRLSNTKAPSRYLSVRNLTLERLTPNTSYEFRIDDDAKLYAFKTLSQDPDDPLRFAIGGDVYRSLALFKKMTKTVAKKEPDFVVLGGDIAYTLRIPNFIHTKHFEIKRWHTFFTEWSNLMLNRYGHLIPLIIAPGNHDVYGPPVNPIQKDSLYYSLIPLPAPGQTYNVLDLGPTFSLFTLDTGHGTPVKGEQTNWLEKNLKQRENVPFKLAIYHEAAYPAYYLFNSRNSKTVRKYWTPLFDRYNLNIAFENDNHTYKRTHPIRDGQIDPKGVLYLGDGAWGVSPRRPKSPQKLWYLAKSLQIDHFYLIEYHAPSIQVSSYDIKGELVEGISVPNSTR